MPPEIVLKSSYCQALDDFAGNVAPAFQRSDFTALLVKVLFFQREKKVAIEARVKFQPVLLVQRGLQRVRLKRLAWTHGNTSKHHQCLLSVNPRLSGHQQHRMLPEKRSCPYLPRFQSASLGCALINCRMEARSSSLSAYNLFAALRGSASTFVSLGIWISASRTLGSPALIDLRMISALETWACCAVRLTSSINSGGIGKGMVFMAI